MIVKAVHFIPQCPGIPVYEMMNGSLCLPYTPKGKPTLWLNENEVLKNVTDPEKIKQLKQPYIIARNEIRRQRAILN